MRCGIHGNCNVGLKTASFEWPALASISDPPVTKETGAGLGVDLTKIGTRLQRIIGDEKRKNDDFCDDNVARRDLTATNMEWLPTQCKS